MFKNQHRFITGIIILYVIIFLFFTGLIVDKYDINNKLSVGNVFNVNLIRKINKKIINYLLNFIYLDDSHSKLVLRKGLPVVRIKNDLLHQFSKSDSITNFMLTFVTDLPPSFFQVANNERVKPVLQSLQLDNQNEKLKKKLLAEGTHETERVELKFWQTESTTPAPNKSQLKESKVNIRKKISINSVNRSRKPVIGIYHTHTAENYNNKGYNARAEAGRRGDVVKIGKYLKQKLKTKYNISTIHSEKIHDSTYARSYIRSLYTAKNMVKNNSNLKMMFDIHRDAIGKASKEIITANVNGEKVARIMIVVTNNNYGLPHPNWRKNAIFAKKLAKKMDNMYPGLLRDVKLVTNRRYNQHIHPHALLLEIGGAQNTIKEAQRATNLFADVLASLINEEDSYSY